MLRSSTYVLERYSGRTADVLPIMRIHDRWIVEYASSAAELLVAFKVDLETTCDLRTAHDPTQAPISSRFDVIGAALSAVCRLGRRGRSG